MQVSGGGLTGNEVSITVQTLENGGLFLDPIPGEFLRMPKSSGEVRGIDTIILTRIFSAGPNSPQT